MSALLEQLNAETGHVVANARRSLVQVRSGYGGGGAGTIWHPDGLVLTNAHVIGRGPVRVTLPDGSSQPGRLLARDKGLDVAALAIEASDLPTIALGESRSLQPGQWVLALGHPWGIAGSATVGTVIGAGSDVLQLQPFQREWIAVSLHLRPGYSGGPLVDAYGRLVGINTMMVGPEVGMAVPVHLVKSFLRRELGSSVRPA